MHDEFRLSGSIEIYPECHATVEHNALVTAVAFAPDGQSLLIGDDKGLISRYDVNSGVLMEQERAARKLPGYSIFLVFAMFAIWLLIAWLVFYRLKIPVVETTES